CGALRGAVFLVSTLTIRGGVDKIAGCYPDVCKGITASCVGIRAAAGAISLTGNGPDAACFACRLVGYPAEPGRRLRRRARWSFRRRRLPADRRRAAARLPTRAPAAARCGSLYPGAGDRGRLAVREYGPVRRVHAAQAAPAQQPGGRPCRATGRAVRRGAGAGAGAPLPADLAGGAGAYLPTG